MESTFVPEARASFVVATKAPRGLPGDRRAKGSRAARPTPTKTWQRADSAGRFSAFAGAAIECMSPHPETSITALDPRLNKGLVSIVIASYGRPEMLARAIRSALSQSHPDIEVIVSDDPAPTACHDVIRAVNDPRFRFHLQDTRVGCWKNWTQAVRMARGEYLVFLGDDDWLSPTFVADHFAALRSATGVTASFGRLDEVHPDGALYRSITPPFASSKEIPPRRLLEAILHQQVFFGAALLDRTLATEVWMETVPDGIVADHGMLLRLAIERRISCVGTQGPIYFKTVHPRQLSAGAGEVTQLQVELMRRMLEGTRGSPEYPLLARFTAHLTIVLARHHAAQADLATARRKLLEAVRTAPLLRQGWSQLFQSFFWSSRLIRTSRAQRGMIV